MGSMEVFFFLLFQVATKEVCNLVEGNYEPAFFRWTVAVHKPD